MRAQGEEGGPCRPQLRPLLGDLVAKGSFRGRSHVLYFGIKAKSQGRGIAPLPAPSVSPGRTWSSGHLGVGAAAGNSGGTLRPGCCRLQSVLSLRPTPPCPHAIPLTWPPDSPEAEPHLVPEHSSSCEQSRERTSEDPAAHALPPRSGPSRSLRAHRADSGPVPSCPEGLPGGTCSPSCAGRAVPLNPTLGAMESVSNQGLAKNLKSPEEQAGRGPQAFGMSCRTRSHGLAASDQT